MSGANDFLQSTKAGRRRIGENAAFGGQADETAAPFRSLLPRSHGPPKTAPWCRPFFRCWWTMDSQANIGRKQSWGCGLLKNESYPELLFHFSEVEPKMLIFIWFPYILPNILTRNTRCRWHYELCAWTICRSGALISAVTGVWIPNNIGINPTKNMKCENMKY